LTIAEWQSAYRNGAAPADLLHQLRATLAERGLPVYLYVVSAPHLNHQLTDLGATLREATHTAPSYCLFALPGTSPAKPGMQKVASGGRSIAVEVWDMPIDKVGQFLAGIPPPLGLGPIRLASGTQVHGFLCETYVLEHAEDISRHGGWRAYLNTLNSP
jgi:allophanate hydrolase